MSKYQSFVGWGIIIYALTYLVWAGFTTYNFTEGPAPHAATLLILLVITSIAGSSLRLASWKDILPYSLTWAVCVAMLNIIMSMPFTGWNVFAEPYVWTGYLLVIIAPLFCAEQTSITDELSRWRT